MDISNWGLNNRKLVHFAIVVFMIGGLVSYYNMSKLEDPEITVKQAMILTTYPGASATQVELEVTDKLEKSINSMVEVDEVSSRSMNDMSLITVKLLPTVPDRDVQQSWDMLRRKVGDIQSDLPKGANTSVVMDNYGDVYGMFYAITSDGFNDTELNDYAELLKREFQDIKGVSQVSIYGKRNECIYIEVYQDRMAQLGVHPAEILTTLNGQNETIYSGYYESGDSRIKIAVNDRYQNIEDIGNMLLQGHEEDLLYLKDIAKITMGHETPVRNEMYYDGQRAFGISIAAQSGTDITKIGKKVEAKIAEMKATRLPAGIDFHKVFFQPERVTESLNTFLLNLIESVLIVIVILMFTMGFRSGLIIGASLVIIVFGSFMVLNYLGGTLQRVSLGAFIVAMGMLVDNAIVIIDGILIDMKRGLPQREALTSIGRKTAMPLLGATVIAILAFFPIYLSPDTAGVYVRDLFIVLCVSLLLSWLLALTQVPLHARKYLKIKPSSKSDDMFDSKAYQILRKVLYWGLKHRTFTVCVAIILVLSSVLCYQFLPQVFFPDMNYNQLYIEYKLPEGTNSTKVVEDLAQIREDLLKRDDILHVTTSIGGTPSRYNLVRSIADPSLSYGELIVDFTSPKVLVSHMYDLQDELTQNYPQAYVRIKRYNLMFEKYPIVAQFCGPDPAVLKDLTSQAEEIMRNNPTTRLVCNNWEPQAPVLSVDYNQPAARNIGLTRSDVGLSILASTTGIPTGVFYDGIDPRTIYLRCVNQDGGPIEDLENTPIFGLTPPLQNLSKDVLMQLVAGSLSESDIIEAAMRTIPLGQATNGIRLAWEDPVIIRFDGQRSMSAQCEPIAHYSAESARQDIQEAIEAIDLPAGYTLSWKGEYAASNKSTQYLFKNFPLAIILMIFILILLFKDFTKPIIIFCCLPLILVGVVGGIFISGKTFGFVAIVGVLGLLGMLIKTAIVLMDEIDLQLSQGKEPTEALLNSSSIRFRPVMMASLTTILGVIPLLSDDMFGSLSVTIMGGLLIGTLITLFFIPILYSLFFRLKIK